jgi:anaerobic magnesium-protoporphyrin IX monomethyl ester cyclase
MSVRLVLATAPVGSSERYGAFAGAGSTEPSFGLACLAAVAQQAGAAVTVVEASAQELSIDAALQRILAAEPDVVGFTATTSEVLRAAELAAALKVRRPAVLTVLGGCHVTALPADTLDACPAFDLAVIGEGEETLRELLDRVAGGEARPAAVAGTAVRAGGRIVVNPARAVMEDLDVLPLPAWSLLPGFPGAFRPSPGRIRRWPCASIVLTRGCPNTCVFCDRSVFGNRCRAYRPEYAVRLVRDLYERHGVRELLIEDDTFVIVKARVREFCERLIDARLDMSWSCLGRADRVDPDLLRLMRRAGCWHMSYGIESGDEAILAAMHKRLDLGQIRQAVTWSREAGLRTKGFFIVGFPGETPASLERTQRLALSLPLDDISVMQMTPFPGSELYRIAGEYGTVDRDWRRMNVLNTVFVPHGFTRADLERARSDLLRAFYRRPDVLWRQVAHVAAHPRLIPSTLRGLRAFRRVTGGRG